MSEINITGLDKADVLCALYNNARPLGLGFLQATEGPLSKEDALAIIERQGLYFDYVRGRPLKVDLSGDSFRGWGYDRDQGEGRAAETIDALRRSLA